MSDKIRVLIADDHNVVREGLVRFLSIMDDIEQVGEAMNGTEAVRLCDALRPDVVLMDVVMPVMDGIEATRLIRQQHPDTQIVFLTSFGEEDQVQEGLRVGAVGYLLKNASVQDLAAAIRAASKGQATLSPEIMHTLIQSKVRTPQPTYNLKDRELEVLTLMAEGMTNTQIAHRLSVSVSTVKFNISAILTKLNAESRTQAVALALQHGLVSQTTDPGNPRQLT